MSSEKTILDPYGEPDDIAAAELKIVRDVRPGTGWRLARVVLLLSIALAAGFAYTMLRKSEADTHLADAARLAETEPAPVHVMKVSRAASSQSLTLPGETAAWDESTIYSRVNGYVAKWLVDIGDHVSAGQTLAVIDTPDLDAQLPAAQARLSAAVAEVAVREARADFARTTDARWRESPKGVVSDQEREAKSAEKAEALANLAAAKAQVAVEQAEVDRLNVLTQFKIVKAPFAGVIVQRHINIGDLVTAGSTANTSSLYRLSRVDPMRVFVHAPQAIASRLIDEGAEVEITNPDDPSLDIHAKIARTAKALDPTSRTMRVEIDVPGTIRGWAPGMYVRVKFTLSGADVIQVPAAALIFRSSGPQVAVVDDSGVVAFKDVTIATDDGGLVSVGSGLENGDRVALNLSSQIAAGSVVKPIDTSGAGAPAAAAAK